MSTILELVCDISDTYLDVSVATPLNFLKKLRAVLSAVNIDDSNPLISRIRSFLDTFDPSSIRVLVSSLGSILENVFTARSKPATVPCSSATTVALPLILLGIKASVVASPIE